MKTQLTRLLAGLALLDGWRATAQVVANIRLKTASLCSRVAHPARCTMLLLLMGLLIPWRAAAVGHWLALNNPAPEPCDLQLMLLLSDGRVMASDAYTYSNWFCLTPTNGSYLNGIWSTNAPMHHLRYDFGSQVLQDGRVLVYGGEEELPGSATAEIYDPVANGWTDQPVPQSLLDTSALGSFDDCISEILPNGNVMVAPNTPRPAANSTLIYNPGSGAWTKGPSVLAAYGSQHEASWVKLPDDSILTVDPPVIFLVIFQGTNFYQGSADDLTNQNNLYFTNTMGGTNTVFVYPPNTAERYIPSLNQWVPDAPPPVFLYTFTFEIGAALLLPDQRAIFLGASGHTAYYTPSGSTNPGAWAPGPDIPQSLAVSDVPAAMMVNGKILCAAIPIPTQAVPFPSQTSFFEFDYTAGTNGMFLPTSTPDNPSNGSTTQLAGSFMLDLPDGNVLFSETGNQLYVYVPDRPPLPAGKPGITSVTPNFLRYSYYLSGTNLNGISEGAAFGDDAQMNSNYPLVRMTNTVTGKVYYCRTYNWSSTGVMTGSAPESTTFTVPLSTPLGTYSLVVVANGIPSDPVSFDYQGIYHPILRLNPGIAQLFFSWDDPTGSFMLQSSDDLGGPFAIIPGASSPYIENITSVHKYYRLIAFIPNPPTVTTTTASGIMPASATLNGTITPNGADTTWWFEYGTDTNYTGGITSSGVVTASNTNAVGVSSSLNGLTAGILYHFQLIGTNSAGTNYGGDLTFSTPLPPIVSTLAATAVTVTTAVLNGTIYGNGSGVAAYFQYGTDPNNYSSSTLNSQYFGTGNPAQSYSTTISNLSPSTTYHYRSVGFNCCAEGLGADTNFTTAPLPVPPALVSPGASSMGTTLGTLTPAFNWNAASGAATYGLYIVLYGPNTPVYSVAALTGTSYQLPGGTLQTGTIYGWYMTSFDSFGDQSAPSSSYYFETPAVPYVQTLAATNITATSVQLEGAVNPNGLGTTVYFQIGTSTNYTANTGTDNIGTNAQTVGLTFDGSFNSKTTYHFRAVANNSLGTSYGADMQFTGPD